LWRGVNFVLKQGFVSLVTTLTRPQRLLRLRLHGQSENAVGKKPIFLARKVSWGGLQVVRRVNASVSVRKEKARHGKAQKFMMQMEL